MPVHIACLMPTLPGRDELRYVAVDSFIKQQCPANWHVTIYQDIDPRPSLGAKLNRMIAACDEDYIVLLDDDDWHSPTRVQRQVEPLLNGYEMTGTSQIYYQDGTQGYLYKGDGKWLGGMAFTRSLWNRLPFEDISQGPDTRWQNALRSSSKFYDIADPALFIATIHATNTCRKNPAGSRWSKVDYRMLQDLIRA